MFCKKNNILIFSFLLLFFIISSAESIDEFNYNLLNERLNRIEVELSDLQKSIYSPKKDNLEINENKKGFVSSRHDPNPIFKEPGYSSAKLKGLKIKRKVK